MHSINPSDLSLKFEALFAEPKVQQFFVHLKTDIVTQQYFMSQALSQLRNAISDFSQQMVFLQPGKERTLLVKGVSEEIHKELGS